MATETEPEDTPVIRVNPNCHMCGDKIHAKRAALGYKTCISCGDKAAARERSTWTIVQAGHKQGYTRVTDRSLLRGINKCEQPK